MVYILAASIKDEDEVCVYCGSRPSYGNCCGETHYEKMYELYNGEYYLESEVVILEESAESAEAKKILRSLVENMEEET